MDWNPDTKAHASKFYPLHGRKGKKMIGKPGHDELIRSKHARFLSKWEKIFIERNGREPSEEEARTLIMEQKVIENYDRLRDIHSTTTVERVISDEKALRESVEGQRAVSAIDALMGPKDTQEAHQRNIQRGRLRGKCPIPLSVMNKLNAGQIGQAIVASTFDIQEQEVLQYINAFFGVEPI